MKAKAKARRPPARLPRGGADREFNIAREQFKQGRDYELLLVLEHLHKLDGIGSGAEAAAMLARKEHRR